MKILLLLAALSIVLAAHVLAHNSTPELPEGNLPYKGKFKVETAHGGTTTVWLGITSDDDDLDNDTPSFALSIIAVGCVGLAFAFVATGFVLAYWRRNRQLQYTTV
jgi:hypothetical protein